jgi:hypothetical protein
VGVGVWGELRGLDFPAHRPRLRADPARRFGLGPGVPPQDLPRKSSVYAFSRKISGRTARIRRRIPRLR